MRFVDRQGRDVERGTERDVIASHETHLVVFAERVDKIVRFCPSFRYVFVRKLECAIPPARLNTIPRFLNWCEQPSRRFSRMSDRENKTARN